MMKHDQNRHLRNSLPFIIRAMTGKMGLQYIPVGPPRATKEAIYTNPLPLFLDENETIIVLGDLYHECGHARYTDFTLLENLRRDGTQARLRHDLWNAIEDVMVERMMTADFYGCGKTISRSIESAIKKGYCRTGTNGPADALTVFINLWGRKNILKQNVEPNLETACNELLRYLGGQGHGRLVELLRARLPFVLSTEQSFNLALDILDLIQEVAEQAHPGDQAAPDDARSDSESGGGDRTGNDEPGSNRTVPGEAADTGAGPAATHDSCPSGNPGGEPGFGQESAGADQADKGSCGPGNNGAANRARDILDDGNVPDGPVVNLQDMAQEVLSESCESYRFDPEQVKVRQAGFSDLDRYEAWKNGIQGETMKLQRKLATQFMTLKRAKTITTDDGHLNARRLHLALARRTDVYTQTIRSALPSPAVIFLSDVSGSMAGDEHTLSMQSAIAMCEVMAMLKVPFEMWTYQNNRVSNYKFFDEPFTRKVKERLGGAYASGGTPTAHGLWVTASRLIARREKRKILILTTDGEPDNRAHAREVSEIVESSGIELYGIGVGVPASTMAAFCRHYAVIGGAEQIADALLAALAQRMLQ